jgi:Flp pilus assembly protein TadD
VEKIPFFVLIALEIALLMVIQRLGHLLEWGRDNPLGARLGNAVISYSWYLGKLFWPADLAAFYTHTGYWPLGQVVLAGGLILGVSALVGLGWRRHPYLLVGWLWYCGTLVPNSQVVQTFVLARADRWTYLPLLGVLILIVWGACELTRRWRYQVLGLSLAAGMAIVLCMALTWRQLGYWKDNETLVRHALAVSGDNEWPLSILGAALDRKGQSEEAIRLYQTALRLKPNNSVVRNLLGIALGRRGQSDEAITQFQETIRLSPDYPEAHYNLGNTLLEKGQTDEAIRQYQEVIRLKMDSAELHNNLGLALARKGQTDEAITQYQEALRLQPDDPDIHFNLGAVLARRGQLDEAIRHYQETLRRQPDRAEAHNNLGAALLQQGRPGEAVREFQEALRLKPDYAGARRNLDAALAAQGSLSAPPGTATNR